jgi:hypothetical protein
MSDSRNEGLRIKPRDPHPVHNSLVFVQYNPCGREVWTSIAGDSEAPYRPHVMPPGSPFNCDFSLSSDFPKSCKINRLQNEKGFNYHSRSTGPAINTHPPQLPAATFKRFYRTRAERLARLHAFCENAPPIALRLTGR